MGMIQAGNRAGLGQIRFGRVVASHKLPMWQLDGDTPIQLFVEGQIDLAKPALAQQSLNPVAINSF